MLNLHTFLACLILLIVSTGHAQEQPKAADTCRPFLIPEHELIIPTFLGNWQRNYYGNSAPDTLAVIWKHYLGKGKTIISRRLGEREWAGAGWTGQPLLVKEADELYLIQGAYDHNLKKIKARDGELVWQYKYDDVIKGTGTIWQNPDSCELKNKLVILQGSRLGVGNYLDTKHIPSYRAISYFTGEELWRLDVKWTDSYSRDVDGSALIHNDTAYIGLENSLFTVFSPNYKHASLIDGMLQPKIYQERKLYNPEDAKLHKNNVVTESSPALLNNHIYVASGSGHIWGYSLETKELVWDFYTGSDMDGSVIVTHDSCLIVTIEKQYIEGSGGMMKLDPSKDPEDAVIWFLPTGDRDFNGWEGGVIGSAGVNDSYAKAAGPFLAACMAIDGYLYIVEHNKLDLSSWVDGPLKKKKYRKPMMAYKTQIGASISTPIIVHDKIIAAGYGGLYLFEFNKNLEFRKIARFEGSYESTPIVHDEKIYAPSRNGYFYCLGEAD